MTKSSAPYIVPEAVTAEATSVLSEIPASEPSAPTFPSSARDFEKEPLTPEEERTIAFAQTTVAYTALFNACKRLITRARSANKLKHNYYVCAADLEGVAAEMDGEIAGLLEKALGAESPTPDEVKP